MEFDLFLAAVSIVAASIATWALLRLFPSSDARQAIPLRTDGGFADPFAGWHACPATRDDRAADGRNRKGAIGTVNRINRIGAISSEIP